MTALSLPRWKTIIDQAILKFKDQNVFQCATLDPVSPIPHVRSMLFRGFLETPEASSLPLLISTTDIRSPKVIQLAAHSDIEFAWWISGTQEQFRFLGKAYLIPSPEDKLHEVFMRAVYTGEPPIGSGRLSAIGELNEKKFDWEKKRLETFSKMSAYMKATFCRPTPGSRLEGGEEEAKKWPEKVEEPKEDDSEEVKKNWATALKNFALVVIDPHDVDYIEFAVFPNRRTRFIRTKEGKWLEEALVP